MSDLSIVAEFDERYQHSYYAWNPFYPLAERDLRYYLGEQWDEKERQKLYEEGRNAFTFNHIRKNINLLLGYFIQHQLSSVVTPTEGTDQQVADQLSQLLIHSFQTGEAYKFITESFGGALKTGFNLLTIWMDYRDDPINGDIKFGREPYSGFITDPYFTQLDFSDCSYVIRRKYLSPRQVGSLLPGQEDEVLKLSQIGWSRDDKFTWLPYQTQPNGEDFLAYNEFYKQGWENVPMVVDEETGEHTEWEGSDEALKYYLRKFPQLKVVDKPKRYVECHVIVNDQLMRTEKNQFGLNEYPFTPVVGIFEPESEFWGLKMQSLVRPMIDPQKESNRRRSQMIDVLDSNVNSGWLAKKRSVINPKSLFQTSQGKVIWKTDEAEPGDIEKIQPAQIPPSMFELQKVFDQDIMTCLGINDASFGQTQNQQESGIMMMLRQSSSIVNLQDIFNNMRFCQKQISKKAVKLIQTWTPEKIQRIINQQPAPDIFNKDLIRYDISIQEGILTDSQRQIYFRQLTDLYQMTGGPQGPITPLMLAQAAPIQGKTEMDQQLAQNMKQQQQQAQQAQQVQQQIMSSQMEYNKASSIEKIAGAKERFTRSVANVSLETERAARAIDDRASAALDRVKAIKELATMDDEKIIKYISLIQSMEKQSEAKESKLKTQDVAVAAQGQQIGDQISGMSSVSGGSEPV